MVNKRSGPLAGVRILDLSTIVAGPWAATLLADLGAEVVKVELPRSGDPLRQIAPHKNGVPLWWKVANRNKRGITLDLRKEQSKIVLRRMLKEFDVLVENFRPGTLDRWGITEEWLHDIQPNLTILRLTCFGQTGPYRSLPGFARVAEALSGFTSICGEPDGRPLHMGFPIADAVGGLFGALGIVSALYHQLKNNDHRGQEIDCSLMESMFRLLDFLPIEFDQLGVVRQRSGNASQYAAPGNVYETSDGQWASIAASTQSIFVRLCTALKRSDLITDARFATNTMRVQHRKDIDEIIGAEIRKHSLAELRSLLGVHQVGFSPINDIEDIFDDPHFASRKAIVEIPDPELGSIRMQSVVPIFSRTPGSVTSAGPSLGEHNNEVFEEIGCSQEELRAWQQQSII